MEAVALVVYGDDQKTHGGRAMKIDVDMKRAVEVALWESAGGVGVDTGPSSNTPVSTLQSRGGEDRLAISCYCNFDPFHNLIRNQLEDAKKQAQKSDSGSTAITVNGFEFLVKPTGYRAKDGGPHYKFVFSFEGCSILWSGKHEWSGDIPNVQVHLGSLFCMVHSGLGAWQRILAALSSLGCLVHHTALGRVDICSDLVGVSVSQFMKYYHARQYVSRGVCKDSFESMSQDIQAKLVDQFRMNLAEGNFDCRAFGRGLKETGFWIGKTLQIAVYDKLSECVRDELKFEWMIENRWGGSEPADATRVEFRLSRTPLRNLGITTIEDWFEKRGNVVAYLVDEWFKLTEGHDTRHTERAKVAPLWERVQAAFKALYVIAPDVVLKKVERQKVAWEVLTRQALGCLGSVLANKYGDISTDGEMLLEAMTLEFELLLPKVLKREFRAAVKQKSAEFSGAVPEGMFAVQGVL